MRNHRVDRAILAYFVYSALLTGCASWRVEVARLPDAPPMNAERIERDVAWLADDAREGRGLGTKGLSAASDYIATEFERAGFSPGGDPSPSNGARSYHQSFDMPVSIRVADARVAIGDLELERGHEFEALLSSENGDIEGELLFAGYGISAPEFGYDDYEGIDATDNVVLVLEGRPAADAPGLEKLGGRDGIRFVHRSSKIANARRQGARAILLVPNAAVPTDAGVLPANAGNEWANPTRQSSEIIAIALRRSGAERLIGAGGGLSLVELQERIDAKGVPNSMPIHSTPVAIRVEIERIIATVSNVIAVLEGSDPELRREAVVVGAHYDHLGHGEFSSLMPDRRGDVHNGADDNASGVAGLLELARAVASQPVARRTLVLVAFTGEEAGLIGSGEYLKQAGISNDHSISTDNIIAMLNLDMVGRLREGKLTVFGAETSPHFPAIVRGAVAGTSLKLSLQEGTYVPSDQTSFQVKGIPVLFFFTGAHSEYHTPNDDVHLLNPAGEAEVLRATYRTVLALLNAESRPVFTDFAHRDENSNASGARGYGPYLGTIPDFAGGAGRGVLLQGVRTGSPAELAGLRSGDRIVEFDGASVANLEEYAALLFAARAGDTVELVIMRDNQRVTTAATLGQRR